MIKERQHLFVALDNLLKLLDGRSMSRARIQWRFDHSKVHLDETLVDGFARRKPSTIAGFGSRRATHNASRNIDNYEILPGKRLMSCIPWLEEYAVKDCWVALMLNDVEC